ncbi:MAG: choice-of-anchor D domain-containing protein [Ignavibacterium album]|uniref:choice-of-anchor D domain-containing protein n=1 Tax=Ignavibacterium album TaxID=591197 RepID=UPI0026F01CDE|nr:choice-of-anchor D domain-containing protein [Ignavibacterium album]MCX8105657.1 choice-of-anchor D domain-containing protein [Ignavibacterium album]
MKNLLLLFTLLSNLLFSQTLIQTVNLPGGTFYNSGYGLVYVNGKYWISSDNSTVGAGVLNAVNDQGVQVANLIIQYPGLRASQGLAFDGTDFWYVERKVARCDLFKVSTTGVVLDSITTPELFSGNTSIILGGAAWDGTGLWISVYSPDTRVALYKVNVAARAIVDTILIQQFGLQPTGVTVKGDTLFFVMDGFQNNDERIYAFSLTTKDTLFSFHVPEQPGVRQNPRGLAWDGSYFWLLAEPVGASTGRQLFKYDLGGTGTPSINLITTSINFGNVMIDSTVTQNILIRNYGSANLRIDSAKISNPVFTLGTSFPIIIQPGVTVSIPVSFTPTANQTYNDSVMFFHNDPNFAYSRTLLTGTGVYTAPYIVFVPPALVFGNKRVNSTSYLTLTIENHGSNTLTIDSVKLKSDKFYFVNLFTPINILPLSSFSFNVWFKPTSLQLFTDSVIVYSNASNGNTLYVSCSGTGVVADPTLGNIFWQGQIPPNPGTSYQDYTPRSLKKIQDINGDGIKDIVVATENYWTLAFNGNSSGSGDILWMYSTYFGSINTGSVDYEQCMQIASDLNNDGHEDVVIGTGGGNEFVYTLNGLTGEVLWEFGNSSTTADGDIMGLDVKRDFTNDGIPDVLCTASGNESTGEGRFSIYLLNGANGQEIWRINQAPEQKLKYMVTSTDAGGAAGSRVGTLNEVIGFNQTGGIRWTFPTTGTPWTVKEISDIGGISGSDVVVGTTTGRVYLVDGHSGQQLWQANIGNVFIEDLRVTPDMNNSGYPDILVSGIYPNIFLLEGQNGNVIWQNYTGGNILGKDVLSDLTGDGYPEFGSASLNNLVHIYDGRDGQIKFQYAFGSGGNSTAAEHVVDLDDIDGNYSSEFVACSRDGRVICFSGGTDIIPVEIKTFYASVDGNNVNLSWTTVTEINNKGFEIYRKPVISNQSSGENTEWKIIGFVNGKGTTTEPQNYSFSDKNLNAGKYLYRLKQIDFDGSFKYYNEIEVSVGIPQQFSLEQNYPNPFNPVTKIVYTIPAVGKNPVTLKIFDVLGNEVATLVNENQDAGRYEVMFDAGKYGLASGIYFYQLKYGEQSDIKKFVLMK